MAQRPNYKGLLVALYDLLRSEEYPCPGEHGGEKHSGERHYYERLDNYQAEHDVYDPTKGSCALCGHEVYDAFPRDYSRPILAEFDMPLSEGYLGMGECKKTITIETDSEYGEYSMTPLATWPVASGPCSEALGLDDDEECNDPIFARWAERRGLLHAVERLAYRYHVDLGR